MRFDSDIVRMRRLIEALGNESSIIDFEENMLISSVRGRTKVWEEKNALVGFAFVDDYNNLQFEIAPRQRSIHFEDEIIDWGIRVVQQRNKETGQKHTLDASFRPEHLWQIALLKRHGFQEERLRSLRFERDLSVPLKPYPIPPGFHLQKVRGEEEVNDLVALHRSAFETNNMTVEGRLAIMRSPDYEPDMDFVLTAPSGEMAAFCICGFENKKSGIGYTDPIGTHPKYQQQGLGKAVLTSGLKALQERGAKLARLGTSSENSAMCKLAKSLGFLIVSESIWFSKHV